MSIFLCEKYLLFLLCLTLCLCVFIQNITRIDFCLRPFFSCFLSSLSHPTLLHVINNTLVPCDLIYTEQDGKGAVTFVLWSSLGVLLTGFCFSFCWRLLGLEWEKVCRFASWVCVVLKVELFWGENRFYSEVETNKLNK